jgi:hypothetical protein
LRDLSSTFQLYTAVAYSRAVDVALLGVVVPGVENHSIAVLARALTDAELTHCVIPFEGFAGMREMIDRVLRVRPRVCGISLQTTEAALAVLAFARLLRGAGYDGTIAIGGHLASLAPEDILAPGDVDVVVQLAGERAIVGLARGEDPLELPGTVTAAGRGLRAQPVQVRALPRTRLSEHLGFGAADLIVSRGCPAHCGYCCVATVSNINEQADGNRHVVRDIEPIADELAAVTALGGRAFHFMDDNILPLDPDAALAWLRALAAAFAKRRIPRIAFSLQLRADVVTPAVADALVELGLVRAYVGIDGYTPGQLRAIGRHAVATAGKQAIEMLSSRGVLCVANALLIGPTIGFDTIVREIEGLAVIEHAPVHLLPIEARPGTVYHRRAAARGLIEGGPLWPAYHFEDERTFLVGELITKLPTRLVERSVPIALYDLAWAIGVARRLAPEIDVAHAIDTYAHVTRAWNADQIRVLRAAVGAAAQGRAATTRLLEQEQSIVRAHDDVLLRRCDDAVRDVERAVSALHRRDVRAHTRGRLLGGLAFTMGLAACSPEARSVDASVPADVTIDVVPDAPWVCADGTKMPAGYPSSISYDCNCITTPTAVRVTFNDRGEIVAVTYQNGDPLPPIVEQCFLDLVKDYCYPTYASTTEVLSTCHSWIA